MKRPFTTIALLLSFIQVSKAQVDFNFGIEGGFSMTTIKIPSSDKGTYKTLGPLGGAFIELALEDNFAVQTGLCITGKNADGYGVNYFEIPLTAKWQFGNEGGFFIYAGPYLDIVKNTNDNMVVGNATSYQMGVNRFNVGARPGIGYQFRSGPFFKLGYAFGITHIVPAGQEGYKISYDGITISFGYLFHSDKSDKRRRF